MKIREELHRFLPCSIIGSVREVFLNEGGYIMTVRKGHLAVLLVLMFAVVSMLGCNIFGFTSDKEESNIQKAEQAIRDGDYAQAKKELTDASGALVDSTNSMVLYTYSKAVLLESGLNIAKIVDLIQADKAASSTGSIALLDEIDKLGYTQQTAWYKANLEISLRLARIWNNKTTGELGHDDIALDYSVSNVMGGVLSIRDTNRDGIIDSRDFKINFNEVSKVISGDTVKGFDFNGITSTTSTGQTITFQGLTAFLGTPLGSAKTAGAAGVTGYSPDDINPLIATVLRFLGGGQESIEYLIKNLAESTSYDPEKIREYMPMVARMINFYWYDDGVDNDRDGRVDEEAIDGVDNDKDGLVDEDSHYMKDYDSSNTRNTIYIAIWESWKNK